MIFLQPDLLFLRFLHENAFCIFQIDQMAQPSVYCAYANAVQIFYFAVRLS